MDQKLKIKVTHINNAYKIIRSYLLTLEMMGHMAPSRQDIKIYRYLRAVLKKYKKTWSTAKSYNDVNFDDKDELII
jgi:hypothetical protein